MKQEKISIDPETHKMLKAYCAERSLKIGSFVARLIRERINCDVQESLRDQNRKEN